MLKITAIITMLSCGLLTACGGESNTTTQLQPAPQSSSQTSLNTSSRVIASSAGSSSTAVVSSATLYSSSAQAATSSSAASISSALASEIKSDIVASEVLNTTMGFDIYLPPGYDSNIRYPVLYSLHYFDGNQRSLLSGLGLNGNADKLIASQKINPMIIVAPDYKNSFAVNTSLEQGAAAKGATIGLYKDYLINELIPYVDAHYSTLASREGRFIDGYSMGGFAALHIGFSHPALFAKIGAHSAAFWDYAADDLYTDRRDWLYPTAELRRERDPFLLAKTQDLTATRVYVDVGSSDALAGVDERFYLALLGLGIDAEWHTSSGAHTLAYWRANSDSYLQFFSGKQ